MSESGKDCAACQAAREIDTSYAKKAGGMYISVSKTSRGGLRYRTRSCVMGRQKKRYTPYFSMPHHKQELRWYRGD